ncbi:MAG: AIR synthase-related protein, partial [Pseudomonadota bacterium]
ALLTPTRLYVNASLAAIKAGGVLGLAHITGGGLTENLPRVLPEGLGTNIDLSAWDLPPVFRWLADTGGVAEAEMLKTFNAGIGMVVVAAPDAAADLIALLDGQGAGPRIIGQVVAGEGVIYAGTLL